MTHNADSDEGGKERIGWLHQRPSGFRAACSMCDWHRDLTGNDAKNEADRSLRAHAGAVHPQPIPVFRDPARASVTPPGGPDA